MKVLLSEQLKKLRTQKGNTQEDLANHLGITTQAVSKWERDEGYPDITLLPSIASYYNVSVDDLLGVGQIEKEKKLKEYKVKDGELFRDGKCAEFAAGNPSYPPQTPAIPPRIFSGLLKIKSSGILKGSLLRGHAVILGEAKDLPFARA